MVRFVTPFLYAAAVPAVCVALVMVIATIERTTGLHTWLRIGDIDAALGLVVIGTPAFVGSTLLMMRLESSAEFGSRSHLRQCLLLYLGGIALAVALIMNRAQHGGLAFAYVFMLFATSVYAILMNGLTLVVAGRRRRVRAAV